MTVTFENLNDRHIDAVQRYATEGGKKTLLAACNLRHRDPSGAYVHYDLGRADWERAAIDCLERRDRAARWWMRRG